MDLLSTPSRVPRQSRSLEDEVFSSLPGPGSCLSRGLGPSHDAFSFDLERILELEKDHGAGSSFQSPHCLI